MFGDYPDFLPCATIKGMDVHHLRVFVSVFRHRSFSRASEELGLSQPTGEAEALMNRNLHRDASQKEPARYRLFLEYLKYRNEYGGYYQA